MTESPTRNPGRPPVSSAHEIQAIAMGLFQRQGFDQTSMTQVAAASGVGRTTLFRYFPSKADIVWAGFDEHLRRLAQLLAAQPHDVAVMAAVHTAVIQAFAEAVEEKEVWIQRFQVLQTDTLAPGAALRWAIWASTVSRFVADRTSANLDDAIPAAIGGATQASFSATLQTWLRTNGLGGDVVARMRATLQPIHEKLNGLID